MKNIEWYIGRMRAMKAREVLWRVIQKSKNKIEKNSVYSRKIPVTEIALKKKFQSMKPDINRISINWSNEHNSLFKGLDLFGVFDYDKYRNKWNAGFQTKNLWTISAYSNSISCSQREDIGDIRTNWELNRHFQFAELAKSYYISGNKKYIEELNCLFKDWNACNLFLHGVEWTSAMEIAIRVNSWIYAYCFLKKAYERYAEKEYINLLELLSHGIIVMTDYIVCHRARYSSANNHLIVEMYAVALSGFFYDYDEWKKISLDILTKELLVQNYKDGVNREMSLHYQCFVMEAYGLLMLEMEHNKVDIPNLWKEYLSRMSEFVCDCCGDYGETIVFGDNDEGKILDLSGLTFDYYRYVLDLMSVTLPQRYSRLEKLHENLYWIVPYRTIEESKTKNCYYSPDVKYYENSGYTFVRSRDHKILIAIDHAELGFGALAAHGHADALSFQMFVEGTPIFIDPGTYNYHVPKAIRNDFRATKNHNTICIDEENQAKMLGPFLWGERYRRRETNFAKTKDRVTLKAGIEYNGSLHTRTFTVDIGNKYKISICDEVELQKKAKKISQIFILGACCQVKNNNIECGKYTISLESTALMSIQKTVCSTRYNRVEPTTKVVYSIMNEGELKNTIRTIITIGEKNENI